MLRRDCNWRHDVLWLLRGCRARHASQAASNVSKKSSEHCEVQLAGQRGRCFVIYAAVGDDAGVWVGAACAVAGLEVNAMASFIA